MTRDFSDHSRDFPEGPDARLWRDYESKKQQYEWKKQQYEWKKQQYEWKKQLSLLDKTLT